MSGLTPRLAAAGPKVFFFHTPKAGGTAVGHALERMFAPAERCPLIENTQRDHERLQGNYAPFLGYRYYGGHYGYDVFDAVAEEHHLVSNFRHPVPRLLSLYNYYRLHVTLPHDAAQLDELYPVSVAQHVDFDRFVSMDDERVEVHTRNHQARQLTSSAWDPASRGDLAQAVGVIDRMAWFYVAERQDASARWAKQVFGETMQAIERENVTARQSGGRKALTQIAPATLRMIEDKNRLDAALYAHAGRRLAEQTRGRRRWFFGGRWRCGG